VGYTTEGLNEERPSEGVEGGGQREGGGGRVGDLRDNRKHTFEGSFIAKRTMN